MNAAETAGDGTTLIAGDVVLEAMRPVVNGAVWDFSPEHQRDGAAHRLTWRAQDGMTVSVQLERHSDHLAIDMEAAGIPPERSIDALGVRFGRALGVAQYLRNGYTSWDGSYFVAPEAAANLGSEDPRLTRGHAMTALRATSGQTVVVGFDRHDRFQTRFSFALAPLTLCAETLIDRVPHDGAVRAERLIVFSHPETEEALRAWAKLVAAAAPTAPRVPRKRISGWCSWYSLYAAISEPVILERAEALARFRGAEETFDTFLIDDGFTPEMGDWLETRPTFPRGIKPVLDAVAEHGLTPGLWIAPFMVGNRSRLYAEHPDWMVKDARSGAPLAPMTFYGEFRWHKRSEEYHVLDVTHPDAETYIRKVFRTWTREWGCRYFKTDFMHLGALYGPDEVQWYEPGHSRMAIWMKMARLIREEIGDALWLACGSPIWAPVGLVDAVRIGRDVGVRWHGDQSAESLLRDQTTRNFANGILWQADPDCILLRERFHHLSDDQLTSLALFASFAGGIAMTSDSFDEIPPERQALLRELADDGRARPCDFPLLGHAAPHYRVAQGPEGRDTVVAEGDPVIVQRAHRADGAVWLNIFNTGDNPVDRAIPKHLLDVTPDAGVRIVLGNGGVRPQADTVIVSLAPHASVVIAAA